MAYVNDTLKAWLEAVTGLTGLTINDQLARLEDLNYMIPPRVEGNPTNPPLGAVWTDTITGEIRMMVAGGIKKVADEPPTA